MNNKASTPLTVFFWVLIFFVFLVMFGASFLGYWTTYAVQYNNLSGIEAFLLNNMLLFYILIVIVAILGYAYIGGNQ